MHTTTFSLRQFEPPTTPCFTDTAREVMREIRTMSTTTKARIELISLILGLLLTVASALKVFVYLPPRVEALEKVAADLAVDQKAQQARTSSVEVAIAGIVPQLTAINQGVADIKDDIREMRRAP